MKPIVNSSTASGRKSILSLVLVAITLLAYAGLAKAELLQSLFEQVNPSVVLIKTQQREISGIPGDRRAVPAMMQGSGVVISKDGKIITASHVVHTADRVDVVFLNGETIQADILSTEPQADLALLKLVRLPENLVVATIGNSDITKIGAEVFIIGAPYGIQHSVTAGIISARHKANNINQRIPLGEIFQTDTAINAGNSGGPVFDMNGEVIGVVSHILSQSGGFEGLGFAITSNTVKELIVSGHGMWTGLQGYPLDKTLANIFNLPQPGGLLVEKVAKNSISSRLGLRAGAVSANIEGKTMILGGDIILSVMDVPLHGDDFESKLRERMNLLIKGDKIYVKILRAGEVIWLSTDVKK
ncbi:MAG TPA: trypsin-like peptidase domain-containing protein [Gammaproteobacteria bacterium]